MKVCICDDIEEYRISIRTWVEQYFVQTQIEYTVDEYGTITDLLDSPLLNNYDLFFLDIEFGESVTGLDIINTIREKNSRALFIIITAYTHYLDRAMDLDVLRFIEKPINHKRLISALEKSVDRINHSVLTLRTKTGDIVLLNKKEIVFAEAKFKHTFISTTSETIECQMAFKDLKKVLTGTVFLIPHNSFIVNKNFICRIKRDNIELMNQNKTINIPIAATKRAYIRKQFQKEL